MFVRRVLVCSSIVALGLALGAREAAAEPAWMKVFVSPGAVFSWSTSPDTASGAGFEISAGYVDIETKGFWMPSVGAVYRVQNYDTGTYGSFGRHTIALEGTVALFGLEAGYAYRDTFGPPGRFPGHSGLHLMPFFTLGLVYVGPQILIPFDGKPEFSFNLGLKLPLPHAVVLPIMAAAMSGFRGD